LKSTILNYDYEYYLTTSEADELNQKLLDVMKAFLADKKDSRPETAPYFAASMIIPMQHGREAEAAKK